MASNLIELKDAAQMLGLSAEKLSDLRSNGSVYGYRDGSTWKFKIDELQRFATSENIELGTIATNSGEGSGIAGVDADLEKMIDVSDIEGESILVGEEITGDDGDSHTSTIIGGGPQGDGSDIQIDGESGKPGSDVELVADDDSPSGVKLVSGGSDVLVGGSDVLSSGSGNVGAGEGDTAKLELDDADGDDVSLDKNSLDFDSELSLGSDIELAPLDSAINLENADDDDFVLGSGIDSDVTLAAGGSGINIASPADSGLSLEEEPLELAGSDIEALELGEADIIELEEMTDPDAATQLKSDDDFLLTPVEGAFDESESGSQVIALDSEEFEESTDTMLAATGAVSPLLEAEGLGVDPLDMAGGETLGGPSPLMAPVSSAPEAPYSIANVLLLMMTVLVLTFTGVMLADLQRFMWSWGEPTSLSSTLMDSILSLFGG